MLGRQLLGVTTNSEATVVVQMLHDLEANMFHGAHLNQRGSFQSLVLEQPQPASTSFHFGKALTTLEMGNRGSAVLKFRTFHCCASCAGKWMWCAVPKRDEGRCQLKTQRCFVTRSSKSFLGATGPPTLRGLGRNRGCGPINNCSEWWPIAWIQNAAGKNHRLLIINC